MVQTTKIEFEQMTVELVLESKIQAIDRSLTIKKR